MSLFYLMPEILVIFIFFTFFLFRSLTAVIEQMEQFTSRLGELSSRVESTHEHTAHGLEQGARHRDEQLRSNSHTHTHVCMHALRTNRSKYKLFNRML